MNSFKHFSGAKKGPPRIHLAPLTHDPLRILNFVTRVDLLKSIRVSRSEISDRQSLRTRNSEMYLRLKGSKNPALWTLDGFRTLLDKINESLIIYIPGVNADPRRRSQESIPGLLDQESTAGTDPRSSSSYRNEQFTIPQSTVFYNFHFIKCLLKNRLY